MGLLYFLDGDSIVSDGGEAEGNLPAPPSVADMHNLKFNSSEKKKPYEVVLIFGSLR